VGDDADGLIVDGRLPGECEVPNLQVRNDAGGCRDRRDRGFAVHTPEANATGPEALSLDVRVLVAAEMRWQEDVLVRVVADPDRILVPDLDRDLKQRLRNRLVVPRNLEDRVVLAGVCGRPATVSDSVTTDPAVIRSSTSPF